MELAEYIRKSARTINYELSKEDRIAHSFYGMISEFGEVCSLYQKTYQGHKLDKERVLSEMGDLNWFVAEYINTTDGEYEEMPLYPFNNDMVVRAKALHEAITNLMRGKQKALTHLINQIKLFCFAADIDYGEVLEHNYQKLLKRYPNGFDTEHSLHRAEGDL